MELISCVRCRRRRQRCGREVGGCARCLAAGEECVFAGPRRTRQPEFWVDSVGQLQAMGPVKDPLLEPKIEPGAEATAAPKDRRVRRQPRSRVRNRHSKDRVKSTPSPSPPPPPDVDGLIETFGSAAAEEEEIIFTSPAVLMGWASPLLMPAPPPELVLNFANLLPPLDPNPLAIPIAIGLDSGTIMSLVSAFFKSASSWGVMRSFFQNAHGALPYHSRSLAHVFRHPFLVLVVLWSGAATMACSGGPDSPMLGSAVRLREAVEDMLHREMELFRTSARGYFERTAHMDDRVGQDLLAALLAMQIMLRTLLVNISYVSYLQLLDLIMEALFSCGALTRVGTGTIHSMRELAVRQEWLWLIQMLGLQDLVTSNRIRPAGMAPRQSRFTMELLASLPVPLEEGAFDTVTTFGGESEPIPQSTIIFGTGGNRSPRLGFLNASAASRSEDLQLIPGVPSPAIVDAGSLLTGTQIIGLVRTADFGGRRFGRTPGSIDYSASMFAISVVVGMSIKFMTVCISVGISYLELAVINTTGIIPARWTQADPTGNLINSLVASYKDLLQASLSIRAILSGPQLDAIDEVSDLGQFLHLESELYPMNRLPLGSVLNLHITLHVQLMAIKGGQFRGFGFTGDWTDAFSHFEPSPEVVALVTDILHHAIVAARYVAQLLEASTIDDGPPSEVAVNNGHSVTCVLLSALGWYRSTGADMDDAGYSRRLMLQLVRSCLRPVGLATSETRRLDLLKRLEVEESFGV